ncbi:MAG: 50S ribosomal protein L30 [Bacteroidales bacterium]|nr:50S ribosomal protein L30 [Bacteroidales bacterium]
MKKVRITQIKSGIGRSFKQKRTLQALGFKKMHQSLEIEVNPQIEGMINKVKHLLLIEEI